MATDTSSLSSRPPRSLFAKRRITRIAALSDAFAFGIRSETSCRFRASAAKTSSSSRVHPEQPISSNAIPNLFAQFAHPTYHLSATTPSSALPSPPSATITTVTYVEQPPSSPESEEDEGYRRRSADEGQARDTHPISPAPDTVCGEIRETDTQEWHVSPKGPDSFASTPKGPDSFASTPKGPDSFASTPKGPDSFASTPKGPDHYSSTLLTVRGWVDAQRIPRPPPRNKRAFMVLAHRQSYRCAHCRQLLHPDSEADHIVPWKLAGDDSDGNIQILCPNCHAAKSNTEQPRIRRAKRLLGELQEKRREMLEGVCWGCLSVRPIFAASECVVCSGVSH
jgi:hypothetical protein